MSKKKLILIELNELNFEMVLPYVKNYKLKNLEILLKNLYTTESENEYELLEPWIQWFTIKTGLSAKEHKIFRLGDKNNTINENIYEKLEKMGHTVGAISPMNIPNNCKNPKYFIPDPWSISKSDDTFLSKVTFKMLKQTVNDNAKNGISFKSSLTILFLIIFYSSPKNLYKYIKYFIASIKSKWIKALFLDLLLNDLHLKLLEKRKPNLSSIFLNGAAHIQHHYLFNSLISKKNSNPKNFIKDKEDPFKDVLILYDKIIGDYLKIKNYDLIFATGLSQVLNHNGEYYYRLKNHKDFLNKLNIKFNNIYPRMSRDFLIEFETKEDLDSCFEILSSLTLSNIKLFDKIERKDKSLFVTLTYPNKIYKTDCILHNQNKINLSENVVFTAIKNGKHSSKGYCYFKGDFKDLEHMKNPFNIKKLHGFILNYFNN